MFITFRKPKPRRKSKVKQIDLWKIHKKEAMELVNNNIQKISSKHTFKYNRITIRNQHTRWGSCSSKKNLNFNYRIIHLSYNLAEYLVVHELCHLKVMNHSRDFWDLVSTIVPNYKDLRKRLRKTNILTTTECKASTTDPK